MKKVLLCQDIHKTGRRLLEKNFEVVVAPDYHEETIRTLIPEFHCVVIRTAGKITKEIIEAGGNLEVIGRTGAGVDNVDVETATRQGIPVCYAPEANFTSVAEHTITLILALAKQLSLMDKSVREGRFSIRYETLPVDVTGKTVGIVGFGKIGKEVAKRCMSGLGMNVLWYDPYVKEFENSERMKRLDDLTALFEKTDFVTIHLPYNKETHHMINRALIEKMRLTSFFINTSRGAVVDESALHRALIDGRIAGAGLDVYEKEPPEPDNPLLKLPKVILTPHTAALTKESAERMAVDTAHGVLDVLEGRKPRFVFNAEVFKEK